MATMIPGPVARSPGRKSAARDVAVAMVVKVALLAAVLALASAAASRPRVTAATAAIHVAGVDGAGAPGR